MKRLYEFPSVNYITLFESEDRQKYLEEQLRSRGVTNINAHKFHRFPHYNYDVRGQYKEELSTTHLGIITGHLMTIKKWLEETDEPYTVICEDDVSLEICDYWNFEWPEFMELLPSDWECVVMMVIRKHGNIQKFTLKERDSWDWGATAYLISREFAKRLIEKRVKSDHFDIEIHGTNLIPIVENVLYHDSGKIYNIPLFVEGDVFISTYDNEKKNEQRETHRKSRESVLYWWRGLGRYLNSNEIFRIETKKHLREDDSFNITNINQNAYNNYDRLHLHY
jgi:GR25 family glycosyltransferase involved in LPS biosynthesis